MLCKKCQREIPDTAPFCCWCGKRQEPEKKKTRRRARGTGTISEVRGSTPLSSIFRLVKRRYVGFTSFFVLWRNRKVRTDTGFSARALARGSLAGYGAEPHLRRRRNKTKPSDK